MLASSRWCCAGICTRPTIFSRRRTLSCAGKLAQGAEEYPREVLVVVGLTIGGTTAFYTCTTYMQKFLKFRWASPTTGRRWLRRAPWCSRCCCSRSRCPLRSDRTKAASDLVRCLARSGTIPLLIRCSDEERPVAFLLISTAWLIVGGYTSINAVVKAELFPTKSAHRRRTALRRHRFRFLAGRPINRPLVQVDRLRTWFYYYLTAVIATHCCLCDHARHQSSLRHGTARVGAILAAELAETAGPSTQDLQLMAGSPP